MKLEIKCLLRKARLVQKSRKHSMMRCPDQCVGEIEYTIQDGFELIDKVTTCKIKGSKRNDVDEKYSKGNNNAIVLILESPHIDEFDICKKPIGPAYGITGDNINKYIIEILNDALRKKIIKLTGMKKPKSFDFVLVNAIQYQTSLGVETKIYRDAVFLYLWEKECIRKDFRKRIEKLLDVYKKENIIFINCCTKGYHLDLVTTSCGEINANYIKELGCTFQCIGKPSLKQLVSHEIASLGVLQYYAHHPFSWCYPRNREWGVRLSMLTKK